MALKFTFLLVSAFVATLGLTSAQTGFLPENVTLPPELKDKIDENQLETLKNKTKVQFKNKCEQNGGEEAYEKAQNAGADFTKCLQGLVDMSMLQAEIENAKPNGNVDEVFKKYCAKKTDFLGCAKQMLDTTKSCFSPGERENIKIIQNVTDQLAEFVCFKDGDRIALFIAEGGQECLESKREEIQGCTKKVFGSEVNVSLQLDNMSTENMPQLKFDKEQCNQMSQLQVCVVDVLTNCTKPTSANIMESLFKFIRKSTPCKKYPLNAEKDNKPGSASGLTFVPVTIAMAAFVTLYI